MALDRDGHVQSELARQVGDGVEVLVGILARVAVTNLRLVLHVPTLVPRLHVGELSESWQELVQLALEQHFHRVNFGVERSGF
jgi:hypothetical protein